jgi:hypothetical protein
MQRFLYFGKFLTQIIWTALRGESLNMTDPKNTIAIATILTDN